MDWAFLHYRTKFAKSIDGWKPWLHWERQWGLEGHEIEHWIHHSVISHHHSFIGHHHGLRHIEHEWRDHERHCPWIHPWIDPHLPEISGGCNSNLRFISHTSWNYNIKLVV